MVLPLAMTGWARAFAAMWARFLLSPKTYNPTALTEAAIDRAFAKMAVDADYHRDSIGMTRQFETSDWEAFKCQDNAV
jgi:hypothetical protein